MTYRLLLFLFSTTAFADPAPSLKFTTATVSIPKKLQQELDQNLFVASFSKANIIQTVAWNEDKSVILMWSGNLQLMQAAVVHRSAETFWSPPGGGLLYCKGCDKTWIERTFGHPRSWVTRFLLPAAQAGTCIPRPTVNPLLDNFFGSAVSLEILKSCEFDPRQMVKTFVKQTKETLHMVVSGEVFSQLAEAIKILSNFPDELQQMVESAKKVMAAAPEVFDQLTCSILEKSIVRGLTSLSSGGSGIALAVGAVVADINALKSVFKSLSGNSRFLEALQQFQKKHSGKIPPERLAAFRQLIPSLPPSRAGFLTSQGLDEHYKRHGMQDFRIGTPEDYQKRAIEFGQSKKPTQLVRFDPDSKIYTKWDPETNEFLVTDNAGSLITYYKLGSFKNPGDQLDYFLRKNKEFIQKTK